MSIVATRRALVVDDSRAVRLAAAQLIEPYGFDVDLAEDGAMALRCLEERGAYDLALVDIRMPALDGHDLLRIMRSRHNFTPVVIMTAGTSTRQLVGTLKLGATDFLVKPLEPKAVQAALARALNLPPELLRAESPRVLAVGDQPLADVMAAALPPYVEVDRVERGGLEEAVQRRPYRLVAYALRAALSSPEGEAEGAAAAAAAAMIHGVQPGAVLCAATVAGEAVRGFDASAGPETLASHLRDALAPNAVRPLVLHDESQVVVTGFRGETGTEPLFFAIAGRRLQVAVALQAAARTRHLAIDLSRVPAQSAAVERLAQDALAAAAGRVPDVVLRVAPALRAGVERLGLPAQVEVPRGRGAAPVFRWTQDLAVGVESIDAEHQEIFTRVDALAAALRSGRGEPIIDESLAFLERYALEHFTEEEAAMARLGYPGRGEHLAQHEAFRALLAALVERRGRGGQVGEVLRGLDVVCEWIYRHVRQDDRALGRFLSAGQ